MVIDKKTNKIFFGFPRESSKSCYMSLLIESCFNSFSTYHAKQMNSGYRLILQMALEMMSPNKTDSQYFEDSSRASSVQQNARDCIIYEKSPSIKMKTYCCYPFWICSNLKYGNEKYQLMVIFSSLPVNARVVLNHCSHFQLVIFWLRYLSYMSE